MCRRQSLIGITTCFLTASFFLAAYAKAQNIHLAEEHALGTRKQAVIARENADRVALTALIAKKQAEWTGQKSTATHPAEVEREVAEVRARKTTHSSVLASEDLLFAPDQSKPATAAMRKLSPLVSLLKDQPQRTIRVAGYADRSGLESYNLELSQLRADTVRDFLIANGISPGRITARGYGEVISLASNATLPGQRENRRVEVLVLR